MNVLNYALFNLWLLILFNVYLVVSVEHLMALLTFNTFKSLQCCMGPWGWCICPKKLSFILTSYFQTSVFSYYIRNKSYLGLCGGMFTREAMLSSKNTRPLDVHPCESKMPPALNSYAIFLRFILFFFSFLHIKLVLGF